MYESTRRFQAAEDAGQEPVLLYLGDHDPSGNDMLRDVRKRLAEFRCSVSVLKIALTREQVDQYQLPPQPAKPTDSRYDAYAAEHGDDVWELDALPPDVLAGLVRSALHGLRDDGLYQAVLADEERGKAALRRVTKRLS